MVQGSMTCIKYLIFFFNLIFAICGIAITAVGGYVFTNDYTQFFGSKYTSAPVLLIVLGVIIFLIAFFGCCGAIKENRCMVTTFGFLMFILFIATLAGGITGYMYRKDLDSFLKSSMLDSIVQQKPNAVKVWDKIQSEFHCCGVNGPQDYLEHKLHIPDSCSKSKSVLPYTEGCYNHVLEIMKKNIALVGGFGVGVAFIELLGCIFAWCLVSAIKRDWEGV